MRCNALRLFLEGLTGNRRWKPGWREPAPTPAHDVVIVRRDEHGLATACYLATIFGITGVAVLEKSWLGSANVGRCTTRIHSGYLLPGNQPSYQLSLQP